MTPDQRTEIGKGLRHRPDIASTLSAVSATTGIAPHFIADTGCRHPEIVYARALACIVLHDIVGLSWPEVSAVLGRRGHSGCLTIAKRYIKYPKMREDVKRLSQIHDAQKRAREVAA